MLNSGKMQIIDDLKQVILGSVDVAVVVSAIQGSKGFGKVGDAFHSILLSVGRMVTDHSSIAETTSLAAATEFDCKTKVNAVNAV